MIDKNNYVLYFQSYLPISEKNHWEEPTQLELLSPNNICRYETKLLRPQKHFSIFSIIAIFPFQNLFMIFSPSPIRYMIFIYSYYCSQFQNLIAAQ